MKANELRIGNWYDENGATKQVNPNTIEAVWVAERIWCKPIPLTEEWLLKFGCQRTRQGWSISAEYSLYNPFTEFDTPSSKYYGLVLNDKYVTTRAVQYVHQLQNLYFALTGEELTIQN
jgi:hypothetical protein